MMNNSSHGDGDDGVSKTDDNNKIEESLLASQQQPPPPSKRTKLTSVNTTTTATNTTTSSVYGSISIESYTLMASIITKSQIDAAPSPAPFTLLHADFCPYANRVWIALLEKQQQQQQHQQQHQQHQHHHQHPTITTAKKLFNEILCCYFAGPVKDEGTKLLYSLGFTTVPAAVIYCNGDNNNSNNSNTGGEEFESSFQALGKSSSLLAEYVDDLFSSSSSNMNSNMNSNNDNTTNTTTTIFSSLKPLSDPIMMFNMRYFINKHESFCDYFYTYLMNQDISKENDISQKFKLHLNEINNDLNLFNNNNNNEGDIDNNNNNNSNNNNDGPYYLCGNIFTLADIHIFGFIERTIIVIQHYKKYNNKESSSSSTSTSSSRSWTINVDNNNNNNNNSKEKKQESESESDDFNNIARWYKTMIERPSIKEYVIAERTKRQSKDIMIFEAIKRKEYLIEVYECYANNEVQLAKTIHAKHSRPGYNAYKKYRQEKIS